MLIRNTWLHLVVFAVILGVLTGQAAPLLVAALLLTLIGVGQAWNRWSLYRLSYRRTFDESRVFVGESVGLTLEVANQKALPLLWVRVNDRFPETMAPLGHPLSPSGLPKVGLLSHTMSLLWYERAQWRYELPCPQRGFYFFGPAEVHSGDIFGLFERETLLPERTRLIVYPQVESLERLGMPARNPFGGRRINLPVFEDPTRVVGVRDYHADDPMRRVHWKASARTQKLQVRVWEPAQEQQIVVLLNVATLAQHWRGNNPALLEQVISVAASLCHHAYEGRNVVGLMANASIPDSDQPVKVAPGRSPHQMRLILEALAAVTSFVRSPIEQFLHSENPKIRWGATLVVVTAVVSEALQAELLRLHQVGRRMVLVSLDATLSPEGVSNLETQGIVVHRVAPVVVPPEAPKATAPRAEKALIWHDPVPVLEREPL